MRPDSSKSEDRSDKARQYWDRAKVLAHRASDSENPEMRVAYLELAQQWAALAEHVRPQNADASEVAEPHNSRAAHTDHRSRS